MGEVVRCIDESLALKYRMVLDEICACTGRSYQRSIWLAAGPECLLCQMTANACGIPVIAGPVEATVYGNLAMQLVAAGEVKDLKEVRSIIRNSENMKCMSRRMQSCGRKLTDSTEHLSVTQIWRK